MSLANYVIDIHTYVHVNGIIIKLFRDSLGMTGDERSRGHDMVSWSIGMSVKVGTTRSAYA